MAIFRKGYRPYSGPRSHVPAFYVIARQGWGQALKSWSLRIPAIIQFLVFSGVLTGLLATLSLKEQLDGQVDKMGAQGKLVSVALSSLAELNTYARTFYELTTFLVCLMGIFVGAGVIANDKRSKASSLYLARPLSRHDYVLGKLLVVPGILALLTLIPGLSYWLIVGLWQEPGETMRWYADNADFVERVVSYAGILTCSMAGLMLLVSSLAARSGTAIVMGLSAVVAGSVISSAARNMDGTLGSYLFALGIPRNALREWRSIEGIRGFGSRWQPDEAAIWHVSLALLVLGILVTLWKTRSTEVTE
ncbi:MAG: ABC transporter permease subunit [Planctomycetes bacterium]|nr:ABC transporter permease subunit [Planctomycetota bacterium]MCB9829307.1 ABC transporter permease subunit [Planctomycetota bacterium]MCB9902447.1 ABC transporter permease subunit [Planctomycetota bacterium]